MQRRIFSVLAVIGLVVALAACGSSSKNSNSSSGASISSGAQIEIKNFAFTGPLTAKAGSTVTVKNDDSTEHTVTADTGNAFNVSVPAGSTATFTAPAKAGSYAFHCSIHTSMHGTLTVT